MPLIDVVLDVSDYDAFGTSQVSVLLSEREGALIASLFVLATDRENWVSMSNSQWDVIEAEIAVILEKLSQ